MPHLSIPFRCLGVVAGLLTAAAATGAAPQDAAAPRRLPCGAYEAVPSGAGAGGRPTRVSIQRGGRLLLTVSDWSVTSLACADLDANGVPELVATTFSGGTSCCETVRVWSLGASPRQVLQYAGGSARGVEIRDLDADGRPELLLGDDAFAHFDDLTEANAPGRLPLVACLTEGRVIDCTTRHPTLLRDELMRHVGRLRTPSTSEEAGPVKGAALGALALSVLLGEEARGVEAIRGAVAHEAILAWLERVRARVRDWATLRGRKIRSGRD